MTTEILIPGKALGFWPFSSEKERYVAKIGNKVITRDEYIKAMRMLHTTNRVGEELAKTSSFEKQNYREFLNELIDVKLMELEAENLSLDKGPEFTETMRSYVLNISLNKLNQDEITGKVKVEDREIEEAYRHQVKSEKNKEGKEEKKDREEIPSNERASIKANLLKKKMDSREKEYFAMLRKKANIKVDEDVLANLDVDKPETMEKVVAQINGEAVLGKELVILMKTSRTSSTEEGKKQMLDRLVLHKLLDQEAMRRNYIEEEKVKASIKKYRDELLLKEFKMKVILPAVTVTEEEIKSHYEKNRDHHYRQPDRVDLGVILVSDKEKAEEILAELRKGADFSYLAKTNSIDSSRERGGNVGWTNVDQLPEDIRNACYEAKGGDLLGPLTIQGVYAVLEFRSLEKRGYQPLDNLLKVEIDKTIGREKFKEQLAIYLKRLRDIVPVEINEKELNLIVEGQ